MLSTRTLLVALTFAASAAAFAQTPAAAVVTQSATGFDATIGPETLRVTVCADSIVHVVTRPNGGDAHPAQPWLLTDACPGAHFDFTQDAKHATLKTAAITISLALDKGNLTFATADGKSFLREGNNVPRTYTPETLNGQQTTRIVDRFSPDAAEAIYGLGQHQSGLFNYRGATVQLAQNNTDIAIPLLLSTNGYGIMWNTASLTTMDNRFPLEIKFDTLAGEGADYFVLYGPEFDQILHDYRTLTGHSPMLPRWSYGFIQSKDRYTSLDEINEIATRYRAEHIPVDTIVQDWFWWKSGGEGDPIFNANYHDVPADLKKLHDQHIHTMISTWGMMDPAAETFKKLDAEHLMLKDAHVYDASNPHARDLFWQNLPAKLFAQGWDSFWLDSAEPEEYQPHLGDAILATRTMAIGNGAEYTNIYPLVHNEGIQQHWRATTDQKRVFLLTRSSFLGSQRVGGTVWSGDVYQSWWALSHQVPAGLNYALSGLPYWTTDIGGYHPTMDTTSAAYQELYLRWYQFGTFCPVFRTHGHRPHNELWSYPLVEPALLTFDKLRYRMMPYIYSLAWKVSSDDYTLMRPLPMDFRADPMTYNNGTQFMFGPALLVNPVTEAGATSRRVYLPANTTWYDFWTGEKVSGGQRIEAAAPLDRLPLYVRAGSILPLGPEEEYADEKPNGPIELRIYPGADATFTLYNDEGDNYDYEKGAHATTTVTWSDADRTLTFAPRIGTYPNVPPQTTFHIVLARPAHGTGEATTAAPDKTITYTGAALTVKMN